MISLKQVEEQLKAKGLKFRMIGKPELAELANLLLPEEQILHCINGFYNGAIALLCATDRRILIIDKRPWFLNFDDVHYDVINEVDYASRLFDSTIFVRTLSKTHAFRSWKSTQLRDLCVHVQTKILEARTRLFDPASEWHQNTVTSHRNTMPLLWRRKLGRAALSR